MRKLLCSLQLWYNVTKPRAGRFGGRACGTIAGRASSKVLERYPPGRAGREIKANERRCGAAEREVHNETTHTQPAPGLDAALDGGAGLRRRHGRGGLPELRRARRGLYIRKRRQLRRRGPRGDAHAVHPPARRGLPHRHGLRHHLRRLHPPADALLRGEPGLQRRRGRQRRLRREHGRAHRHGRRGRRVQVLARGEQRRRLHGGPRACERPARCRNYAHERGERL